VLKIFVIFAQISLFRAYASFSGKLKTEALRAALKQKLRTRMTRIKWILTDFLSV